MSIPFTNVPINPKNLTITPFSGNRNSNNGNNPLQLPVIRNTPPSTKPLVLDKVKPSNMSNFLPVINQNSNDKNNPWNTEIFKPKENPAVLNQSKPSQVPKCPPIPNKNSNKRTLNLDKINEIE